MEGWQKHDSGFCHSRRKILNTTVSFLTVPCHLPEAPSIRDSHLEFIRYRCLLCVCFLTSCHTQTNTCSPVTKKDAHLVLGKAHGGLRRGLFRRRWSGVPHIVFKILLLIVELINKTPVITWKSLTPYTMFQCAYTHIPQKHVYNICILFVNIT